MGAFAVHEFAQHNVAHMFLPPERGVCVETGLAQGLPRLGPRSRVKPVSTE
jgi:hypothetical protein